MRLCRLSRSDYWQPTWGILQCLCSTPDFHGILVRDGTVHGRGRGWALEAADAWRSDPIAGPSKARSFLSCLALLIYFLSSFCFLRSPSYSESFSKPLSLVWYRLIMTLLCTPLQNLVQYIRLRFGELNMSMGCVGWVLLPPPWSCCFMVFPVPGSRRLKPIPNRTK